MGYRKAADGVVKKGKTKGTAVSMGGHTGMKAGGKVKMKAGGMPKMMNGGMAKTPKMAYGGAVKKMRSGGSSCK